MKTERHPGRDELALSISGDLPVSRRLAVRWHLRRCAACQREIQGYGEARARVRGGGGESLPGHVDWDELSSEMTANIRLGLAAGEIVRSGEEAAPSHLWRAAVVMASVLMLAASVIWWYHRTYNPETTMALRGGPLAILSEAPARAEDEVVLKATLGGIGVEQNGQAMALAAENEAAPRGVTVSLVGAMNARYVDEDGAEVTIHRVYTE
ncbi:MAG: hypothetical protein R2762_19705 [Bryobacteraceae bacterium]